MTSNVTDLNTYKFQKSADAFAEAADNVFKSESDYFKQGKFSQFADSYIESEFDDELRPVFHVMIDFRDYTPSEEAQSLLRRLKSDRFEIQQQRLSKQYLARLRRDGFDPRESYGPFASAEVSFEEAMGMFSARGSGRFGAYQTSINGYRISSQKIWDDRGVGFHIIVCGKDHRRNRFEEHIIDNDTDMAEVITMMSRIRAARMGNSFDVVPFRR
jgi:hypothetical protein